MNPEGRKGKKVKISYRAQQPMLALHNLAARAEEQKRASAVCTLGLALCQALVPNERRLLVTNQATDGYTSQGPISNVAVNL